jgi:hypothetical protein
MDSFKDIDVFDQAYCERIRDAVWKTIIETSRDPKTKIAALRNYEIYDALLQLQAMILASSKETGSPIRTRETCSAFAKRLWRLIAEFKEEFDLDGVPFDVVHSDEVQ